MDTSAPDSVAFAVHGPITRDDLPGLSDRVGALLAESGAEVAVCDLRGVAPDAVAVDALARLELAARRHGCQIQVGGGSPDLCELISFMGLRDVLCSNGPLRQPPT
jgi:ABC-type transporter Mla MlaB component